MAKVTMTLYEALEKKKNLETRVDEIVPGNIYSCVGKRIKGRDTNDAGVPLEEFDKVLQSGYDSGAAVLSNYIRLKAAINESNSKTKIKIGDREYTVANAIMQYRLIPRQKRYWQQMQSDILSTKRDVERNNENVSHRADEHVETMFKDAKNKDTDTVDKIKESYMDGKLMEFYDPLKIEEKVEKKMEELTLLEESIHFALTQSNVNTTIEVEFED